MCKNRLRNIFKCVIAIALTLTITTCAYACSGASGPKDPYVLSELSKTLTVDQSFTLEVLNLEEEDVVTWESSDFNVISIENGLVTALRPGEATVTATINGKKLTCEITVELVANPVPVISIENAPEIDGTYTLLLIKGQIYPLEPQLKLDGQIQTCSFELNSQSESVTVEGLSVIATEVCENVKVTASCTFNGERYSVDCNVSVREVA